MAGIIAIYGLVVSVLIADGLKQSLPLYTGFIQLGAGLAVGLSGLAAGYASLNPRMSQLYVAYNLGPRLSSWWYWLFLLVLLSVLSVMLVSVVLLNNQDSTSEWSWFSFLLKFWVRNIPSFWRGTVSYEYHNAGLYGLIVALLMNSRASLDASC